MEKGDGNAQRYNTRQATTRAPKYAKRAEITSSSHLTKKKVVDSALLRVLVRRAFLVMQCHPPSLIALVERCLTEQVMTRVQHEVNRQVLGCGQNRHAKINSRPVEQTNTQKELPGHVFAHPAR